MVRTIKPEIPTSIDLQNADDITTYVYENLLPFLEGHNINLSAYGNHRGQGTLVNLDEYEVRKNERTGFNIETIIQVVPLLPSSLPKKVLKDRSSYGLKRDIVEVGLKRYITNGDFILAMLLCGYGVIFEGSVNCSFKNP